MRQGLERSLRQHMSMDYCAAVQKSIGVASYGELGHVRPLDFQLVILGITRFTDSDENVQNNAIFVQFLSIFGPCCHFLPTVFLRE